MTYVVLGATSGLGRAIAECLAMKGIALVLASRDIRDANAEAADLFHRYNVCTQALAVDLARPADGFDALDTAVDELGGVDGIVVAAGEVSGDDALARLGPRAEALVRANFLSACQCIDHLLPRLLLGKDPVIVGIGSIAAFRGRARNVVYSAAKRALQSYFESLRHALSGRVRVHFYHVGYLDTHLSSGQPLHLPAASAQGLARRIAADIEGPGAFRYYPGYWRAVRIALAVLPSSILRLVRV